MSTIASPRPSISLSSRRTSASTDTTHAPSVDRGSLRRNRAALRDYYGLKSAGGGHVDAPPTPTLDAEEGSELDKPEFDAAKYVSSLLASEGLEGVLKVEAGLVSEIRSLDGEKKALVYDNYSKLIAATDTIRNMREKMDPLTPTTSTLTPAIGHIAETASALSNELKSSHNTADVSASRKKKDQQATVRWVMAAPKRVQALIDDGQRGLAEKDWKQVSALLDKWCGVRGVQDVREACLRVLEEQDDD